MSDTIYYDTYNEGEAPKEEKSKASRIAGIVWKTATVVAVAVVFFIIFYRIFEMSEPSGTGEFLFTSDSLKLYDEIGTESVVKAGYGREKYAYEKESLTAVYLTKKGESKEDYESVTVSPDEYYEKTGFKVYEANIGSYKVTDEQGVSRTVKLSGFYEVVDSPVEGALRATHVYLVPAAKQVQLTFRYKDNVMEKLGGHTASDGSVFRYTLRDDKGRKYTSYAYKTDEKSVYRYITMVFDGVELSDVEKLTLDMSYIDGSYEDATLSIDLYDGALPLPLLSVDVDRAEATALKKKG